MNAHWTHLPTFCETLVASRCICLCLRKNQFSFTTKFWKIVDSRGNQILVEKKSHIQDSHFKSHFEPFKYFSLVNFLFGKYPTSACYKFFGKLWIQGGWSNCLWKWVSHTQDTHFKNYLGLSRVFVLDFSSFEIYSTSIFCKVYGTLWFQGEINMFMEK